MRGTVREATVADAAAVARVHLASWRSAYRGLVPDAFLDSLYLGERTARWREQLTHRPLGQVTHVAEVGGEIVGFAAGGACRDEDAGAGVGELYAIYVAPGSWRQGVGGLLQAASLDSLREREFVEVRLWVLEGNAAARAFYEHSGWAADGATDEHPFGAQGLPIVRYRRPLT
ncbi:MAG TPA: GNAT family N-acetyltransferase [Gaiellales bacterium]|nr:GNAT family N-acetyltransferase [Gaiellales bacterium]